jgi:hypothetical protein
MRTLRLLRYAFFHMILAGALVRLTTSGKTVTTALRAV